MTIDTVSYRRATPNDQAFLDYMNVVASFPGNSEDELLSVEEFFLGYPDAAAFSENFGRDGDIGIIALDEVLEPIGAIWGRDYVRTDRHGPYQGHPFELTMAMREVARHKGVGRQLLDSFALMARLSGKPELALGVYRDNKFARELYEKAGFLAVLNADGTEAQQRGYILMNRPLGVVQVETLGVDSELSIADVQLSGMNHKKVNSVSTTTYQVQEGEGVMIVDGVRHELKPGVIVEVPAGTPYFDYGNVTMRAVSVPPFNPNDVEVVPFVVADHQ